MVICSANLSQLLPLLLILRKRLILVIEIVQYSIHWIGLDWIGLDSSIVPVVRRRQYIYVTLVVVVVVVGYRRYCGMLREKEKEK